MIKLKDVVMEYPGHLALNGLCLSVPAGQVAGGAFLLVFHEARLPRLVDRP